MRWVQVTAMDGARLWVNMALVRIMDTVQGGTQIHFSETDRLTVRETVSQLLRTKGASRPLVAKGRAVYQRLS